MTTTPQLPPELEKQFDEELGTLNVTHIPIRVKKNGEVMQNAGAYVKHFLAQALQDQRSKDVVLLLINDFYEDFWREYQGNKSKAQLIIAILNGEEV